MLRDGEKVRGKLENEVDLVWSSLWLCDTVVALELISVVAEADAVFDE